MCTKVEKLLVRLNQDLIYPKLIEKAKEGLELCVGRKAEYWAISGFRSPDEQSGLYAKGRTKPGRKVTWVKAFGSYHNYGLALDFSRDKDTDRAGLQPDWNILSYKDLAECMVEVGLEAGYNWKKKDACHIQWPISKFGFKNAYELKQYYIEGGVNKVWSLFESKVEEDDYVSIRVKRSDLELTLKSFKTASSFIERQL